MPKRKANWWPPSILSDPDVLSVDDEGRFVLCKICHVHYAVHGGKKPKPVIMNSNFRTRAWDVHKERTNSHRLQKQQERLQQAKQQAQQQAQTADTQTQQQQQLQPAKQQSQVLQSRKHQRQQGQQRPAVPAQSQAQQAQAQSQSMSAIASQAQTLTRVPPHQVQRQLQTLAPPPPCQQQQQAPSSQSEHQALQRRRPPPSPQDLEETKDAGLDRLQTSARNSAITRPTSAASPETIASVAMSGATSIPSNGGTNGTGKRPAPTMPVGAPASKRRVFRAGSPGSSMQLIAESEAAKRSAALADESHPSMLAGAAGVAQKAAPTDQAIAMEQADSSARWRHMHDDVSRALNSVPRKRQQGPASYTSGELRAAKTLAQTETGDLGGNNSERVAKKLRSLNAEYHASNMRHADGYNMRHGEVFDRRSASYKEYWGTLRDVYTSSGTTSGGSGPGNTAPRRKSHHRSKSIKPTQEESKEAEADSTTPDDSGSSEDAFKPAVIVHDASLINAIERLTDATSKQIASLYDKGASGTQGVLTGLTSVMTDLRVQQGNAFGRIIELQEKHLKVMEGILEIKLRKEAARNSKSSSNSNGSTSGSSSGSSTEKNSTNGGSGV